MKQTLNFFDYKTSIAKNLLHLIQKEGYSKRSFAMLTEISRPTLDVILKAESTSQTTFNGQILKIIEILKLPMEYLVREPDREPSPPLAYAYSDHGIDEEKSEKVRELLNGLDNVLEIYSMYV